MAIENTKNKILMEAMKLFSTKGYAETSVVDIATAVGIKAPSLYKHFESKRAIFDTLFNRSRENYEYQIQRFDVDCLKDTDDAFSVKRQIANVKDLFSFILHNQMSFGFRKLVEKYQEQNSEFADLCNNNYLDVPLVTLKKMIQKMVDIGILKDFGVDEMALAYTSVISVYLQACIRRPEREAEAVNAITRYIEHFNKIYANN